eukprot:486595_1
MSNTDDSGFSPEERHNIIISTLQEFEKTTDAFQQRWNPDSGHLLTGELLSATPMFWFMKYKWSRSEIETLFFKSRIVIDSKFDTALQQTFGGDPGPRWKGGGGVRRKNYRRAPDVTDNRDWLESEEEKGPREADSVHGPGPDPNFEYNPVIQPVDFEATGGVDHPTEDPRSKEYPRGPWERLPPKTKDDPHGSGPVMGKGVIPSDANDADRVRLKPVPDGSDYVNVECPDGELLRIDIDLDDPLSKVKRLIEDKSNGKYPANEQVLSHNRSTALLGDKALKEYGVKNRDTLVLMPPQHEWQFGPLRPYDLQMPPKGPNKKYKVDPLEAVDYRIKQEQGIEVTPFDQMPDL